MALVLSARSASAEDAKQAARDAFQAGVKLFQTQDYHGALEKFREADAAAHSPAIIYNEARALEKLDLPQRAVDTYEAYVGEAGEAGEFTQAAVIAIAQIKARSTKLSIESTPPGAQVTLDDEALSARTPITVLVARGSHRVSIALDDWREVRSYDAPGAGATGQLVFVRSAPSKPAAVAAPPRPVPPPAPRVEPHPDGLVLGAGISLSAYRFFGKASESSSMTRTTADSTPGGLVLGLALDAGYALTSKTVLSLRIFGGLGSAQASLVSIGAGGPVLSYHLSQRLWTGGGVAVGAGKADADATTQKDNALLDSQITFKTNFAIGPTLELSYVLDQNDDGHWRLALMPTLLITTTSRESTLIIPLALGYCWY
jgi:hypothetical protein